MTDAFLFFPIDTLASFVVERLAQELSLLHQRLCFLRVFVHKGDREGEVLAMMGYIYWEAKTI